MSALPSIRPSLRPHSRIKKRCSPVSADRTQGALGVRYDSTTGLHYMRARWYDSSVQRFISRDPLRSKNRYEYAGNSPVNFIDPTGLDPTITITPSLSNELPQAQQVVNDLIQALSPGGDLRTSPAINNDAITANDYLRYLKDPSSKLDYSSDASKKGGAQTHTNSTGTHSTTTFYKPGVDKVKQYGDKELRNILIHEVLHAILRKRLLDILSGISANDCNCKQKVRNLLKGYQLNHDFHYEDLNIPVDLRIQGFEIDWLESLLNDQEIEELVKKLCK